MNNITIIRAILTRVAKEHNCFSTFKKYYDEDNFFKTSTMLCDTLEPMSLSNIFAHNYALYYCIDKIKKDVNIVLFELLQPHILWFLNFYGLTEEFETNLRRVRHTYYNSGTKNISEYISFLKNNDFPPFDFFTRAFSWSESTRQFDYWSIINRNFRRFLISLLKKKLKDS